MIAEDNDGTRRNLGGGKRDHIGAPQGEVISLLISKYYLHTLNRICVPLGFCFRAIENSDEKLRLDTRHYESGDITVKRPDAFVGLNVTAAIPAYDGEIKFVL